MKITAGTIVNVITTNNGTGRGVDLLLTRDFDPRGIGYGSGGVDGDYVANGRRCPVSISGDRLTSVTAVGRWQEPAA